VAESVSRKSGCLRAHAATIASAYTYARWLRLLVSQAVTDMARSTARPARPVLFLLDEFAALGRLEPVERAMGLMAGYGLQLWPILQDMHQLRANYGERAGTFMSNAGVVQAFGVNDHATADMLSRTIGDTTLEYDTVSTSRGTGWIGERAGPSESVSAHVTARRLATPDEIGPVGPKLRFWPSRRTFWERGIRY